MIAAIMQPAYLPWLGFYDRLDACDVCIVLDHVAMDKSSKTRFANRNRIRTPQGWSWLTVPLALHGSPPLCAMPLAPDGAWRGKHLASLDHAYLRTPWYSTHRNFLADCYSRPLDWLHEASNPIMAYLADELGIETPMLFSSRMQVPGGKSELILNLCREVGADTYISGPFGRDYLDMASFAEHGIGVLFHDYAHPEYAQAFPGFEPYMAAVDLLFNHGPASREILVSGRRLTPPPPA